ncbi:MAG: 50S ribosomal protein L19 [Dehalococcoidales bacterium]|nr:50S ribosomal protein L19 [Dehalococcoidales bacterium]
MDVASLIDIKKNKKIPDIAPGDTVKVSARIVEAGKERIQMFQGVVLKIKRGGTGASFTVRHVAYGIGVERTFPFNSPLVEKVEIVRQGKVRRSRLYYLRSLSGKEARRKIKRVERKARQVGEELIEVEPEEELEPEDVLMDEEAVAAAEEVEAAAEEKAGALAEKPEAVEEEKTEPEAAVEEKPEAAVPEETPAEEKAPEAAVEEAPAAEEEKVAPEETPSEEPVAKKEEPAEAPAEALEETEKETS